MTDHDYATILPAHRRRLVELLESLSDDEFATDTLCAGWQVPHVLAHITMPFRYTPDSYGSELAVDGFDFNKMADRVAKRDAADGPGPLLQCLRDNIETLWAPPGGGLRGGLSHDVIHGLDITIPLGRDERLDDSVLAAVLSGLGEESARQHFAFDPTQTRLQADDFDYAMGEGELVAGRAQDLIMVVAGRKLPVGHLDGPGSSRFTA